MTHVGRCSTLALALCAAAFGSPPLAEGQLDPLLFLKSSRPYVVVALDLSSRMQRDLADDYRDPRVYRRIGDPWEATLGVNAGNTVASYRRAFTSLRWLDAGGDVRAEADEIHVVGDRDAGFAAFDRGTRLGIVRAALARAIGQNARSVSFGLVASRQRQPALDLDPPPAVRVTRSPDPSLSSDTGVAGQWRGLLLQTAEPGGGLAPSPPLAAADAGGANARVLQILARDPLDPEALIPAGFDAAASLDAPLLGLLDDVRAEVSRLASADPLCRNIIVLLVAAGDQAPALDPSIDQRAEEFLDKAGRRVPIHVVGLAPGAAAARLARVAAATGGTYTEIAARPRASDVEEAIHEVVRAVNGAVQHGIARFADVSVRPAAGEPFPAGSEYSTAAPLVGTVNLLGARDAQGQLLPGTGVTTADGVPIPQASNVVVTAGFAVPGFEGRLRGFRVYRPEADASATLGHRFVADGTRMWTAAAPDPSRRNVFTVIPGLGMVAFTESNAAQLAPYLRAADAAALVRRIRALPIGAITHSTPALLTPPAETLADPSYLAFADANRDRRSLVFFGADDGMLHAVDARTGLEAWAVVPFNLLPKLRLLEDGQPLDEYRYFVGGSPRLADVRTAAGWKTILIVGEGAGGTFYQAFDVTLADIGKTLRPDNDAPDSLLGWFADPGRIGFLWSYPPYGSFDPALLPAGDVAAGAPEVEKTVGETWSTPSVFRFGTSGPSAVVVGSGPLAASVERRPNRGGTQAGTSLYLLDGETGSLLDSRSVGADGVGEDHEACAAAGCSGLENALAADPAVVRDPGGAGARVYLGDLDGRFWRADVRQEATGARFAGPPRLLYEGSAGEPIFAAAGLVRPGLDLTFLFVATGSDVTPSTRASPPGRLLALEETRAGVAPRGQVTLAAVGSAEERATSLPALAGETVFFSTTFVGGSACDPGVGRLYALDFGFGVAYDWNGDGRRDGADLVRLGPAGAGRVSAPVVADRHLFVLAGDQLHTFGDSRGYNQGPGFSGVKVLSWREVH